MTEIEALREEVAALRREVAELRRTSVQSVGPTYWQPPSPNVAPSPLYPGGPIPVTCAGGTDFRYDFGPRAP